MAFTLGFLDGAVGFMGYDHIMPSRSSKPKDHDFITVGRNSVERIIGEKLTGEPPEDLNKDKNPHAVALGRLGGQKGGKARASVLSRRKRSMIARKAANVRWNKEDK